MGIPAVRTAIHSTGVGYAMFYRPMPYPNDEQADLVVVRSNPVGSDFGVGAGFDDLLDGTTMPGSMEPCSTVSDGAPGFRVAKCIWVKFVDSPSGDPHIGGVRLMQSNLSIAVAPSDANRVVVAWTDSIPGSLSPSTLHVAESVDGGNTWTMSPYSVDYVVNPAIAVSSDGMIGLLFQRFIPAPGAVGRWQTIFALVGPSVSTAPSLNVLADTPAIIPAGSIQTIYGDFIQLTSVGKSFYGVFAATNDLTDAHFWPDFKVYRRYSGPLPVSILGAPVAPSIDPYFFRVLR
jgi:hypothetical protein